MKVTIEDSAVLSASGSQCTAHFFLGFSTCMCWQAHIARAEVSSQQGGVSKSMGASSAVGPKAKAGQLGGRLFKDPVDTSLVRSTLSAMPSVLDPDPVVGIAPELPAAPLAARPKC